MSLFNRRKKDVESTKSQVPSLMDYYENGLSRPYSFTSQWELIDTLFGIINALMQGVDMAEGMVLAGQAGMNAGGIRNQAAREGFSRIFRRYYANGGGFEPMRLTEEDRQFLAWASRL